MGRPKNCGKCNKPKRPKGKKFKELPNYCECGRPLKLDENVLSKLEGAFMSFLNDQEACAYAGISIMTLWRYEQENPEFSERKKALRLRPNIKAKQTVVSNLGSSPDAWRWLERRDPEFKPVTKTEMSGSVEMRNVPENLSDEEKEALQKMREARRKRVQAESKVITQ